MDLQVLLPLLSTPLYSSPPLSTSSTPLYSSYSSLLLLLLLLFLLLSAPTISAPLYSSYSPYSSTPPPPFFSSLLLLLLLLYSPHASGVVDGGRRVRDAQDAVRGGYPGAAHGRTGEVLLHGRAGDDEEGVHGAAGGTVRDQRRLQHGGKVHQGFRTKGIHL